MDGHLIVLLLALGICYVTTQTATSWRAQTNWFGATSAVPDIAPVPVYNPLVLAEATVTTSLPPEGASVRAADPAVYWTTVSCPASRSSAVIGDCSWTGTYLADAAAGEPGSVDWDLVCVITKPCGSYGVGSISANGRGTGTLDGTPVDLAIVGGTGAYAGFGKGGVMSFTYVGRTWTYNFRFAR